MSLFWHFGQNLKKCQKWHFGDFDEKSHFLTTLTPFWPKSQKWQKTWFLRVDPSFYRGLNEPSYGHEKHENRGQNRENGKKSLFFHLWKMPKSTPAKIRWWRVQNHKNAKFEKNWKTRNGGKGRIRLNGHFSKKSCISKMKNHENPHQLESGDGPSNMTKVTKMTKIWKTWNHPPDRPPWGVQNDTFFDQNSGILLFLRVFRQSLRVDPPKSGTKMTKNGSFLTPKMTPF